MRHLAHALAAALALVMISAAAQDYDLPSIGQPADRALTPADEARIGAQVVSQLLAQGMIVEDPELSEYVNRVGHRLARHTDRAPSKFHFYMIDDERVNAFALPGGYIGVNAGLLLEADDESELAGVLAHESAHVTQRHIARQIEDTKGLTWATAAAMLLAIIAGGGNPAVIQAAVTLGVSNLGQQQINFTRAHEFEADRLGIRTLAESDYDPNAMASFFKKLERHARLYGNKLPEILQTHPVSQTRIAEARARARGYNVKHIWTYSDFALMRARTRVVTSKQPSKALRYYEQERKSSDDHTAASDYGYALALARVGHAKEAVSIFRRLAKKQTTYPHFQLALAQARADAGDVDGELSTLAQIKSAYPSYRPLVLAYAQALLDNNHGSQAREFLLSKGQMIDNDAQAHNLLAQAAAQMGHKGAAYYHQAQYHHLRGEYGEAMRKLQAALHLPKLSEHDKARIQAAMARYRSQCIQAHSERACHQQVEAPDRARG